MKGNPATREPDTPLSARTGFLLSQLGFHAAHRFAQRLEPLGLQPQHFGLLIHLSAADGRSQQQLADAMDIHRNAMVGLVDDLEERGLVLRGRHPSDRRAHAVRLTDTARELLTQAQRAADEHDDELMAVLDESDRRQLLRLLQRVAEGVGLRSGVHPGLRRSPRPRPALPE